MLQSLETRVQEEKIKKKKTKVLYSFKYIRIFFTSSIWRIKGISMKYYYRCEKR